MRVSVVQIHKMQGFGSVCLFAFPCSGLNTLISKSVEASPSSFNVCIVQKVVSSPSFLLRDVFRGSVKKTEQLRTTHRYQVGGWAASQPHQAEIIGTRYCPPPVFSHHTTPCEALKTHSTIALGSALLVSRFNCLIITLKHLLTFS